MISLSAAALAEPTEIRRVDIVAKPARPLVTELAPPTKPLLVANPPPSLAPRVASPIANAPF